jgi:S-DNA-T family DNA segregation ATPase FtsK/SpoIIIE
VSTGLPLSPRAGTRFELRLTIAASGSRPASDVVAELDEDATVAVLARALAAYVRRHDSTTLWSPRCGPLDARTPVGASPLRDGDIVSLDDPGTGRAASRQAGPGDVEVAIVGGPAAGRRVTLGAGRHDIGRDPAADVVVADPSLSRRHITVDVTASGTAVTDAGSSNGAAIDGRRLREGEPRAVTERDHIEIGRSLVVLRPWRQADAALVRPRGGAVEFNRPPRMARPYDPPRVEVQAPPSKPTAPRLPLTASLVPLFAGIAMFLLLDSVAMLMFSALSPIMAVSTFMSDRRGGRHKYAKDLAAFNARLATLADELEELGSAEVDALRAAAPDPAELSARAEGHLTELWERRPDDADFLSLRVGIADQPTRFEMLLGKGGEEEHRERAEQIIERNATLAAAPLVTSLPDVVGIGLTGPAQTVDALGRWLVLQAAVLHSPRDVLIAAALSRGREQAWSALQWLPHATAGASPIDHDHFAVGEPDAGTLLRAVAAVVDQRRADDRDRYSGRAQRRPFIVLVVDEDVAPPRALVEDLLSGTSLDLGIIWLGSDQRDLPGGCGTTVDLAQDRAAMSVAWPKQGRLVADATPDGINTAVAEAIARGLAPVRDVGASGAAADIPRSVSLLELVDLVDISSALVRGRWERRTGTSLDAVIGHRGDGPLALDMRADGPHALVAGTTGAGKSELLQTLVTGLALNHPPDRLSFLFVDYKGGAAFKDCVELPHTVGMVTDLDTHLTRRALLSLNAELRRREEILRDTDAKDLVALERRRPDLAPASLVIVIDEFAALKNEVPEFVDGVVDIAQRGRSLGVHLVLATQRPSGIVSENIRANTNLRVALRVSKQAESDDVIGDPGAARISRSVPGRGLIRTGHGELTEFQSAYVGGHSLPPEDNAGVRVRPLRSGASGTGAAQQFEPDDEEPTDLERVVLAIGLASEETGRPLPPSPWQPMLPEILPLDSIGPDRGDADPRMLELGLVDDPARQRQYVLGLDLERDGHLFIYGTSGAGKTTLLRSLAVALARKASPEHLQLYALDFAGRGMLAIEELPHCGAVILAEDEERITRLFTLLRRGIDARAQVFAGRGVNTLSEYERLATAGPVLPRTVILLDSYAGFRAAFENVSVGALIEALTRIIADGRAVGMHVIATADRRNAVPPSVSALVPRKLVLRQADDDEYGSLGLDRKATKGAVLPAGRGFTDDSLEIQTPLVGDDPSGDRSVAAIAAAARALSDRYPGRRATPVQQMPTHVPRAGLPVPDDPVHPFVGVDEIDVAPLRVDVSESHFLVAGPYRSGRTSALATLAGSIRLAPGDAELHLLAPRRSALTELGGWTTSARGSEACTEAANRLREIVLARSPDEEHPLLFVVIDDAGELADGAAATPLEMILRRGRDVNVRVIASIESAAARGFSAWIRELRKDGNGLLLTPDVDLDGDLLAVRLPRRSSRIFPPGRGYLVSGGRVVHLQVAGD